MPDSAERDSEHVFDQTNGVLGFVEEDAQPDQFSERDRRRQLSTAQALGYINTGHN